MKSHTNIPENGQNIQEFFRHYIIRAIIIYDIFFFFNFSDIYIKSDYWDTQLSHKLAVDLHELISAKKLILIASENGDGRVFNLQESLHVNPDLIQIADNECLVGVYCDGHDSKNHGKVYNISLVKKSFGLHFR